MKEVKILNSNAVYGSIVQIVDKDTVSLTTERNATNLAGVVSTVTNGVSTIETFGENYVRVVGTVKPGDLLVTSGIAGVAIVTNNPLPYTVIGRALESYDSERIGNVLVALSI